MNQFPDSAGLVQLSTTPPVASDSLVTEFEVGPWSPDGKKLFYRARKDWYLRDMSRNPPGPERLIAPDPPNAAAFSNLTRFSWSADSRSVAWVSSQNMFVFDPASVELDFTLLTRTGVGLSWAPTGGSLLYDDVTGSYLVNVDAGVPGRQQALPVNTTAVWAPDGRHLLGTSNGNLSWIDSTGVAAPSRITAPTVARPSIRQTLFSADGSRLAFIGTQTRTRDDVFDVVLEPSIGEPIPISNGALDMTLTADQLLFFSPNGRWLGYSAYDTAPEYFGVDLGSPVPGTPFGLGLARYSSYFWLQRPDALVAFYANDDATLFNLPSATPTAITKGGAFGHSLSPGTDFLALNHLSEVSLLDLETLNPPSSVPTMLVGTQNQLLWSPDGQFLSVLDAEAIGPVVALIRVSGAERAVLSAPVAVSPATNTGSVSVWQPVFR